LKRTGKMIVGLALAGLVTAGGFAYAETPKRPVDILSELTGRSVAELQQERLQNETYGSMAKDAGKLDEFEALMLKEKKVILDQRVAEGKITEQQAAEIYESLQNKQSDCEGPEFGAQRGSEYGIGFGKGQGMNLGRQRMEGQTGNFEQKQERSMGHGRTHRI